MNKRFGLDPPVERADGVAAANIVASDNITVKNCVCGGGEQKCVWLRWRAEGMDYSAYKSANSQSSLLGQSGLP